MIPTLKDMLDILEKAAPSHIAEEWDNPGLQVGHLSHKIEKIFISLDPTPEAVKEASLRNAQLLLTHHPLFFKPLLCLNREVYPGNVIYAAFKKGISIVAAHTNLDMTQGGINDILADLFNLQNMEMLKKRAGLMMDDAGLGRIGNLPEAVTLAAMVKGVKRVLGVERVRVLGKKKTQISRVAIVGGAGGGMVSVAFEKGADLLVTGEIRHHEALEAKTLGLSLIDGGHFHTEKTALAIFADHLKKKLKDSDWQVDVEVYNDEKDPLGFE